MYICTSKCFVIKIIILKQKSHCYHYQQCWGSIFHWIWIIIWIHAFWWIRIRIQIWVLIVTCWEKNWLKKILRKGSKSCDLFTRCGVSQSGCGESQSGCGVFQWLVRPAAVRQLRVRFPPGTPPSAQQDELFTQAQEFMPSSGWYHPAGEV